MGLSWAKGLTNWRSLDVCGEKYVSLPPILAFALSWGWFLVFLAGRVLQSDPSDDDDDESFFKKFG